MTDLHQGDGYFYDITPPQPKANGSDERKTPKPRFTLVRFADLKADNEPEYLVPGIIPAEGFGVVWGPPKGGQIILGLRFAYARRPWLVVSRHGSAARPVAYCAFEGAAGFKKRATAFRQRHQGADEAEFFLIGGRADLIKEHQQLIADIKKQTGDRPPRVVCLDTLNRSLVGSENKDEDMSAYIRAADAIRESFPGSVVVVVHHCGISGDRPRGHTSLTGAVDFQLKVWKDGNGNVCTEVEWLKEGEEGEVLISRLEQVEVGRDKHGNAITSCVVVPSEARKPQAAERGLAGNLKTMFTILHDAGASGLSTNEWNERAKKLGIGVKRPAALYDARTALKQKGLVYEGGDDRWLVKHA